MRPSLTPTDHPNVIAHVAAYLGMHMIGTTVSRPEHRPVSAQGFRFFDAGDNYKNKLTPEAFGQQQKLLHTTNVVGIAILTALFGSINSRRQRLERCLPITGVEEPNFGWGVDLYKSRATIWDSEFAPGGIVLADLRAYQARTHARAELINAALDTDDPLRLTGAIDFVYSDGCIPIKHDYGNFLTTQRKRTIFSLPIVG